MEPLVYCCRNPFIIFSPQLTPITPILSASSLRYDATITAAKRDHHDPTFTDLIHDQVKTCHKTWTGTVSKSEASMAGVQALNNSSGVVECLF
jgi:hypothetical protein